MEDTSTPLLPPFLHGHSMLEGIPAVPFDGAELFHSLMLPHSVKLGTKLTCTKANDQRERVKSSGKCVHAGTIGIHLQKGWFLLKESGKVSKRKGGMCCILLERQTHHNGKLRRTAGREVAWVHPNSIG